MLMLAHRRSARLLAHLGSRMTEICDDCVKGAKGSSVGGIVTFAGVDAYISRPKTKASAAIVILTDVFGPTLIQTQEISNSLADEGFLVVVPDLFNHDSLPSNTTDFSPNNLFLGEWRKRHFPSDMKLPIAVSTIQEIREKELIQKIGCIGYCYGGKISILLGGTDYVNTYIAAHPSTPKIPEELEAIKHNGFFICAETDNTFGEAIRKQAEEILSKKSNVKSSFKLYPGTTHGFAVRPTEQTKQAQQEALQDTINFFKQEL